MVNNLCAVNGCNKESYPGCGLSFHRLPTNADVRNKWIEMIPGRINNNSVICSLHFKRTDYLTEARKRLKYGVIPSIFSKITDRKKIYVLSVIRLAQTQYVGNVTLQGSVSEKRKQVICTQTTAVSAESKEEELKRKTTIKRI